MATKIKAGDKVKYSAKFLRSIGAHTGDICFATGTVAYVKDFSGVTIAIVDWGPPVGVSGALTTNLVLADKPELP